MAPSISPRSIIIGVFLLFATNVFAASAVLGVDLGTEYIKATLVKPGIPLEIVLTKDTRRKETSAVAFKPSKHALSTGEYPERAYGSDAIALAARFPGDVYPNLKTLLGLPTTDAVVKEYATRHPSLELEAHGTRNTVAFKSKATADEEAWMVEELLAMELQSIQRNAEAMAGSSVRAAVITIPPYFTIEEKRAVELACNLVDLKVLSLITDGLAVGLNYATSRTFPNINEKGNPEYHMVFDMGAGSTKATVMKFQSRNVKDVGKFNKTVQEVQGLGSGWDRTLGGDEFNYLIVDDMISKFVETSAAKKASVTAEGIRGHGRAMAKLLKEAERLRHILSANVDTSTSFEGLYEDVDFRYKVTRAEFENLAETHIARVVPVVEKALEVAGLEIKQLDSIILHGGASRTPFVQKTLERIAGSDKVRSNVNSDEAAVFGAGFRAADLSPSFRVKEIRVSDKVPYALGARWKESETSTNQARIWTHASEPDDTHKEIEFTMTEDFSVRFNEMVGFKYNDLTEMTTKNLTATATSLVEKYGCSLADVRVKANLRLTVESGEVTVVNATAECETEEAEKEGLMDGVKNLFGFGKNKDQKPLQDGENSESSTASEDTTTSSSTTSSASTASTSAGSAEGTDSPPKKRTVSIPLDFSTSQLGNPTLAKADLTKSKDRIKAFESSDKARRLREEALNQLEGFTYKIRDLLDSEAFVAASTAEQRKELEEKAGEASNWLYEEGADASREVLKSKLKTLKDLVSPIEKRIDESAKRPELISSLKNSLNSTNHWIATIKKAIQEAEEYASSLSSSASVSASTTTGTTETTVGDPNITPAPSGEFDGLEDDETTSTSTTTATQKRGPAPPLYSLDDMKDLTTLYESILSWLDEKIAEQEKLPATADPVLLIKDIQEKTKQLEQAGVDMAMRSVKRFESRQKKAKSSSKSSKTKSKKSTKTDTDNAEATIDLKAGENYIKLGEDGEFNAEELEKLIEKMQQEQKAKDEAKEKHDEL
ncbi:actin-like ATPase domain-containing protein [Xylariaceae sp. FL0255]|nr:actin-like ATPase domain-containing protein [Xylariaceae sp. FL0255]